MASDTVAPQREPTPNPPPPAPPHPPSSIPQKRVLEEDYAPAVSSPLNPDVRPAPRVPVQAPEEAAQPAATREKRTKKESLKKREAKGAANGGDSARATPDPKPADVPLAEVSPIRYKLPPPRPSDFEPPRGPVFTSHHVVTGPDGREIEFFEASEHVYNKKNFHYTYCIADPAFPSSLYYRQTEPEPYGAHINFADAATHMFFDPAGRHVTTDKGFRMARANVAVREGRWYWECRITRGTLRAGTQRRPDEPDAHGHVRVGWARREASLNAPVGFDAYSYGIRDVGGQKVHMSRPKDFFPPGEDLREGDVLGLEIQLPSEHLHRKVVQGRYNPAVDAADEAPGPGAAAEAPNIVRDRIPIRFKANIYFEKIDYHTVRELDDLMNPSPAAASTGAGAGGAAEPPNPNHRLPSLRTLPHSHIRIYKNGVPMGTPWTNLFAFLPPASRPLAQPDARDGLDDGMLGYYPAVSVFRGGAVEVNFGPRFWYPPPGYVNPPGSVNPPRRGRNDDDDDDVEMRDAEDGREEGEEASSVQEQQQQQQQQQPARVELGASVPIRPVSERYDEQIVEDIVYDVIDEVAFWMQDGGKVIDRTSKDEKAGETAGMASGGREEIKELFQDD